MGGTRMVGLGPALVALLIAWHLQAYVNGSCPSPWGAMVCVLVPVGLVLAIGANALARRTRRRLAAVGLAAAASVAVVAWARTAPAPMPLAVLVSLTAAWAVVLTLLWDGRPPPAPAFDRAR